MAIPNDLRKLRPLRDDEKENFRVLGYFPTAVQEGIALDIAAVKAGGVPRHW